MTLSACHPPPPAHKWASRNPAGEALARRPGGEEPYRSWGCQRAWGTCPRTSWRLLLVVTLRACQILQGLLPALSFCLSLSVGTITTPCPTLDSGQTRRSLDEVQLLGRPLPANAALLLWLNKCWAHSVSSGHRQMLHSASKTVGFAAAAVSGSKGSAHSFFKGEFSRVFPWFEYKSVFFFFNCW